MIQQYPCVVSGADLQFSFTTDPQDVEPVQAGGPLWQFP